MEMPQSWSPAATEDGVLGISLVSSKVFRSSCLDFPLPRSQGDMEEQSMTTAAQASPS